MDQECSSNTGQSDAPLIPAVDFDLRSIEDVLAEDDRITPSPTQQYHIGRIHGRGQELGLSVDVLEVVLFAPVPGNGGPELHVHSHTRKGDEHAGYPHEESEPHRSREGEDLTRCSKYARADHSVEHEEDGRDEAYLSPFGASDIVVAISFNEFRNWQYV